MPERIVAAPHEGFFVSPLTYCTTSSEFAILVHLLHFLHRFGAVRVSTVYVDSLKLEPFLVVDEP